MKEMNIYDKIKRSMDLDDPRRQNVELMEKFIERIPTEAGKKYALSKLLNDPKYGMTDPTSFKNQNFINDIKDAWSLKYQDDYTPPDIEKTLSKANKEQAENFWNWDSDEHWTKRGIDELKRQADRAGYGDNLAGYLDKVRELQTDKDKHKASERFGYNYWGSVFAPRTVEAVQRGKDPSTGDIALDATENAMYLLNPVGRAVRAWLQSAKAGSKLYKYGKSIAGVADVLSNPLILETADANTYSDKDNTDRKNFNTADVLIGTGINAGMNKLVPMLWGNKDKIVGPVQKSKAQLNAEEEARIATQEANKTLKDGTSRKANERYLDSLQDEVRRQDVNKAFPTVSQKRKEIQKTKDLLAEHKVVEPRKTTFRERLLSDLDGSAAVDYLSNKTGDVVSEDPKLTRQVISRIAEGTPMAGNFLGGLIRDYYSRKDKNVEQDKIDQAIKLLGRRK